LIADSYYQGINPISGLFQKVNLYYYRNKITTGVEIIAGAV